MGAGLPAKPTSPSQGWSELTQALHVLMPRRPGLRVGPWNPREQRRTEDMKPKPLAGRQARPGLQPRVGSNALQCAVKNGGGRRALGCRARVGTQTPKPRPSAPTSVHRGQAHPPPTPRDCLDGPAHGRPPPQCSGTAATLSLWTHGGPFRDDREGPEGGGLGPGGGLGGEGLGVEDDFGDLPVLHRGSVVVPRRVTEGEAGLSPCGGRLVGHLAQAFGAIVRVRALGGVGGGEVRKPGPEAGEGRPQGRVARVQCGPP